MESRLQYEVMVRADCAAGRFDEAATRALRALGPEITSYLHAVLHQETDTDEAFSSFAFMLWRSLRHFQWHCTLRTWTYMLARRALAGQLHDRMRRRREVQLTPEVIAVADQVRSQTLEYLRTETKDRMVKLREEMEPDDQTLLILRVDRKLSWSEIAQVMSDEDAPPSAEARLVVALRKRFERIKNILRERLQAAV